MKWATMHAALAMAEVMMLAAVVVTLLCGWWGYFIFTLFTAVGFVLLRWVAFDVWMAVWYANHPNEGLKKRT